MKKIYLRIIIKKLNKYYKYLNSHKLLTKIEEHNLKTLIDRLKDQNLIHISF